MMSELEQTTHRADLPYWLALIRFVKFGAKRMARLSVFFKDMQQAFEAPVDQLIAAGIEKPIAEQFIAQRVEVDPNQEFEQLNQLDIQAITMLDDQYPPALKELYDPPALLFIRGSLPESDRLHLAVVGARRCTPYGERIVRELIEPLAANGVVIVSGLARGIDAYAHQATLRAQGSTIAVLGSGVDDQYIYPSQNRALGQQIISNQGAVISEFPIGTHALKQHFPFRNRIIAGLAKATLIIEAAEKSGSLITARCALEAGRDVFAVPGSIHSPLSVGPNNLIKMGATPVTSTEDLFEALQLKAEKTTTVYQPDSKEEDLLYNQLSGEPLHIDQLTQQTKLPAQVTTSTLTLMEMKGSARHVGGQYYVRG